MIITIYHPAAGFSRHRRYFSPKARRSECRLTADLLLPPHLVVEVVELLEEVVNLAALVVSLGGGEHAHHGLLREVLADVGDRKHDLLHGAVVTHDLTNTRHYGLVGRNVHEPGV